MAHGNEVAADGNPAGDDKAVADSIAQADYCKDMAEHSPDEKPKAGSFYSSGPESKGEVATSHEVVGWYVYDWANSPFFQVVDTLMKVLLKRLAEFAALRGNFPTNVMSTGAYPAMIMWGTAALQTVCLLSFAPFGDYGRKRKQLLKWITFAGSGILVLTIFCFDAGTWWFAGILRVFAGVCHLVSTVYYTSYLPLLVASHYTMEGVTGEERFRREVELSDEMSAKGFGLGYAGGLVMQAVSFLILFGGEKTQGYIDGSEFYRLFMICLCVALSGVWWSAFSLYPFRHLKTRPGPPFPPGNMICLGWKNTCETLILLFRYWDTLLVALSYFLWSDALNTVVQIAVLILDDTSEKESGVMIASMLGTSAGILGIGFFMKVQQHFHISSKAMLVVQLIVSMVVSIAAGCGLVTAFGGWGFYFVLGPIMIMIGTLQSNARSLFSSLSPVGKEVAMFSLFTITDKGSTLIGAGVIGVVHTTTGSYHGVFWYAAIAFGLSSVIMLMVDMNRGIRKARGSEFVAAEGTEAAMEVVPAQVVPP